MRGKSIQELTIGEKAQFQKTITEADVYLFAGITGDMNPVHINEVEAKKSIFKERVAHGMLIAGLISTVIGNRLPGQGTVYLGQELKFTAPVKFGDTILAQVEIIEIDCDKNIAKLNTICTNQNNTTVLKGTATVMPPKKQ